MFPREPDSGRVKSRQVVITKDANWESWKQSLLDSLDDQFKRINILNVNDIDNAISLMTKTMTDCAN